MFKISMRNFIYFLSFILVFLFLFIVTDKFLAGFVNDYFITKDVLSKNVKPSENIVMVVVDKKSIEQIRWPWQRMYYATSIDFIEHYGKAKVLAFDIVIDKDDLFFPESDKNFYNSVKNSRELIGGFDVLKPDSKKYLESTNESNDFSKLFKTKIEDRRKIVKATNSDYRVRFPEGYFRNIKNLGATGILASKDGMVRNFNPVIQFNDKVFPSIALASYAQYKGIYDYYLTDNFLCSKNDNCKSLKVPIKRNAKLGIYSSLKWMHSSQNSYAYKYYSAVDIVNSFDAIKNGKK